jgi:Spy/CpxP family protein refolding chaperone
MRKFAVLAAFAAVGVVAGAGAAKAQDAGTPPPRAGRGPGGRFGRGGMGMDQMLLKGITLTDVQKTQLEQLHQAERAKMQQEGQGGRGDFEAMRDARQKGDTATANRLMAEMHTKMAARREEQIGSIRNILTDDQRQQFDANVAELKSHQGARGGQHRPPPAN